MKYILNGNMEHIAEHCPDGSWKTLCGRIWDHVPEKRISDYGWQGTTLCRSCVPSVGRVWINVPIELADLFMASTKHRLAAEALLMELSWLSDEELDARVSEAELTFEKWIATNGPF